MGFVVGTRIVAGCDDDEPCLMIAQRTSAMGSRSSGTASSGNIWPICVSSAGKVGPPLAVAHASTYASGPIDESRSDESCSASAHAHTITESRTAHSHTVRALATNRASEKGEQMVTARGFRMD